MVGKVALKETEKDIDRKDEPESTKEDDRNDEKLFRSATIQLQSLAATKATLERHGQLNDVCRKAIDKFHRALRLKELRRMTQKTINDIFKNEKCTLFLTFATRTLLLSE